MNVDGRSITDDHMNYEVHRVSDEEMYFFDLRGYLVIPGVLSQAEIDACNAAIDAKLDQARTFESGRLSRGSKALGGGLQPDRVDGDARLGARVSQAVPKAAGEPVGGVAA